MRREEDRRRKKNGSNITIDGGAVAVPTLMTTRVEDDGGDGFIHPILVFFSLESSLYLFASLSFCFMIC